MEAFLEAQKLNKKLDENSEYYVKVVGHTNRDFKND